MTSASTALMNLLSRLAIVHRLPLKLVGATGSPTRPVALIVEEEE